LDAAVVIRAVGRTGASIPIAESGVVGGWLLTASGRSLPAGVITVGEGTVAAARTASGWHLQGRVPRVAFAHESDWIVGLAQGDHEQLLTYVVPVDRALISRGLNLAGEARDDVDLELEVGTDDVSDAPPGAAEELRLRGALSRALLIAGAAQSALDMVLLHTRDRHQFGRPIAAFQAVQQQVAALAGETAAARTSSDAAVAELDRTGREHEPVAAKAVFAVAAAKVRTAQAAGVIAAIAHQMHGAIGMTREHHLRFATGRLWSWRDEWGRQETWARRAAAVAVATSRSGTWPLLTGA
jgi:acyl-CoA dehydrogenase